MTEEQLLVYLWSIYPGKALSVLTFIVLTLSSIMYIVYQYTKSWTGRDVDELILHIRRQKNKYLIGIIIPFLLLALVPSKRDALAIFATKYIVESYVEDNGKLNKLDTIINKTLDKADKLLNKE